MNLKDRVSRLEGGSVAGRGWWHRVIQDMGISVEQAIDCYGRDRIGAGDHIIVRGVIRVPV